MSFKLSEFIGLVAEEELHGFPKKVVPPVMSLDGKISKN